MDFKVPQVSHVHFPEMKDKNGTITDGGKMLLIKFAAE